MFNFLYPLARLALFSFSIACSALLGMKFLFVVTVERVQYLASTYVIRSPQNNPCKHINAKPAGLVQGLGE